MEALQKDPYDEAELKVRKNIRRAILLNSQLVNNSFNHTDSTDITAKRTELVTLCNGIESDLCELQRVIHAIEQNPKKYRISKSILDARQTTINEFRSKLKNINLKYTDNSYNQESTSYATNYVRVQLQNQQDVITQQDAHLNELHGSALNLHSQTIAVNTEVMNQNRLLRDIESDMGETQLQLGSLGKKLSYYLDTNNPSLIRLILILTAIASLLIIVLIIF